MKSKWFNSRALLLHVALLLWLGLCASAGWWQLARAVSGNSLSFMYSIEWPAFGVLGVIGWFALLNMEKATADEEVERRKYEDAMRAEARVARERSAESEDPTLAAYNDHLASLATKSKKKLWGH